MFDKDDKSTLISTPFRRAPLDRNVATNTEPFRKAIENIDLSGLAVLDFGCGEGFLEHLLKNSNADVVYAFEVLPDDIDPEISAWANDPAAKPRLIINPPEFKIVAGTPDGDMTAYDYKKLLSTHNEYAIVSNPPYFLFNRILSLTDKFNLSANKDLHDIGKKFAGGLMLTSGARLGNHPGWSVVDIISGKDFRPPVYADQYLVRTGFEGRLKNDFDRPVIISVAQQFPHINDRNPQADPSDYYPEIWKQLEGLNPG